MSLVFVEINEADLHFLDKFIEAGKLPTFARMRSTGTLVRTHVPEWSFNALRNRLSVTEVAPALLALYGIEPQPWQTLDAPVFALA